MKKLFYLLFVGLGVLSSCTDEGNLNLDVYMPDNITVEYQITEVKHDTVVSGKTYSLDTWKVKATIKNAEAGRYSATLAYPNAVGVSGSGLEQVIRYAKAGKYTVTVKVNTNGGSKSFDQEITTLVATGLPMTEEEIAFGLTKLAGKTWVINKNAKGSLANTWWESDPNGKATSKCYDDEYVFDTDFAFHCNTNGDAYGNPDAKGALSRFPALSFGGDESAYDIFINVNESARAPYFFQIKKMKDNIQDPKSEESFYIKLSSDEAHLGYFDEMVNNPDGRYYKIMDDKDADDNTMTLQSYAYNADGSINHFRQSKLIVKGYVPAELKKPDGIYNMIETFEGNFKADYNYAGNDTLIYDVAGSKYLFNPTAGGVAIVADPIVATNMVVKVTRAAADKSGFLYTPLLPIALDASKGLVVSVKVFIPVTNVYVWNDIKEGWAWDPTGKPVNELVNLRVRLEHPNLDGGAWQTRLEKDVNLYDVQGQWVTIVFHMTKPLMDAPVSKKEVGYKNVGFMFGREGYGHVNALEIYYDDIRITTPAEYEGISVLKSGSNVINVY